MDKVILSAALASLSEPILIRASLDWTPATCEHSNAMSPAIYLNKQIDKVAPHKKQKRGRFKRSSKG